MLLLLLLLLLFSLITLLMTELRGYQQLPVLLP